MKWNTIGSSLQSLWGWSIKTPHNRIVSAGLLVGLAYLPLWLRDVVLGTMVGAASLLMVVAVSLGLHLLWRQRRQVVRLSASAEDSWLGHIMILSGVVLAPFCSSAEWSQKLVVMFILCGIAISSWGLHFFKVYPLSVFLIGLGLVPDAYSLGREFWQTFTPPFLLERTMAWLGAIGLQLIGQPATAQKTFILLPNAAVDVQWACNGFNMAAEIAIGSFLLGLFLKQKLPKIVLLMVIGIILALVLNVPRVMLLAMADAYWGKASFDFWHGVWGGQIFSTLLFTIYYYLAMAIVKQNDRKKLVG